MDPLDLSNTWILLLKDGLVVIDLAPEVAPQAVGRIQELTRASFYDGLSFHRVVDGFVAQGGDPNGNGTGGSSLPDLPLEPSDMSHTRGAVSFARASDPNSANSQFFIVLEDSTFLDQEYTWFGEVIAGMNRVDNIKKGEGPNGAVLGEPDRILDAIIASDITPRQGTANNDVVALGTTDIILDLGAGRDVLDAPGNRADYQLGLIAQVSGAPRVTMLSNDTIAETRNIEILAFDDGTLVVDTADPMYTVYGLYQAALDRAPDPAGLRYFADLANQGALITDIARDLAGSPEFSQRYGELGNQDFVEQMYRNILDREGEAAGVNFFTGVLNQGATRGEVLRDFVTSEENVSIISREVGVGVWIEGFQPF